LQTLIPWAQWLGARVELVGELAEGSGPQALALIRSLAADKAAVCTHGDMIAEALAVLADEDHLDFGLHPRRAKGRRGCSKTTGAGSSGRPTYRPGAEVEAVGAC
jgi:hypothetical protein